MESLRKNKRGWIKVLEVFIVIILISTIIFTLANVGDVKKRERIQELVFEKENKILKEIQMNSTLRNETLYAGFASVRIITFNESAKNKFLYKNGGSPWCSPPPPGERCDGIEDEIIDIAEDFNDSNDNGNTCDSNSLVEYICRRNLQSQYWWATEEIGNVSYMTLREHLIDLFEFLEPIPVDTPIDAELFYEYIDAINETSEECIEVGTNLSDFIRDNYPSGSTRSNVLTRLDAVWDNCEDTAYDDIVPKANETVVDSFTDEGVEITEDIAPMIFEKINQTIDPSIECRAMICRLHLDCALPNPPKKDLYAQSIAITNVYDRYDPRKIILYCWEK